MLFRFAVITACGDDMESFPQCPPICIGRCAPRGYPSLFGMSWALFCDVLRIRQVPEANVTPIALKPFC